jgi:uncharacterized membrane protein
MLMICIAWLSSVRPTATVEEAEARELTLYEQKFAAAEGFEDAYDIVLGNCSMCHAREPFWDGIRWAPKGVYLETHGDVARQADQIYLQAGVSHAMPPPQAVSTMTLENRETIIAWVRSARAAN